MPKKKQRTEYSKVSLPKPLMERVEEFISEHPKFGFTNPTQLIKHAVIEKLDRYDENE